MKATRWMSLAVVAFSLVTVSCNGTEEYSKQLDAAWKGIFRVPPEYGEYRWLGYPVDNYGVLTAYDPTAGSSQLGNGEFICDTWYCIGVADKDIPKGTSDEEVMKRLGVNGFVAQGSGAPITVEETKKNELAAKLLLPSLAKVLNIDANFDWKKSVTLNITLGKAYIRRVRPEEFAKYIREDSKIEKLKTAFANGRLAYVGSDIVIEDVEASIKLNRGTDAGVKATLDKMVGTVLGSDSSLNFSASSSQEGAYTMKIKNPVIVAVQLWHQKEANKLAVASEEKPETTPAFPVRTLLTYPPTARKM